MNDNSDIELQSAIQSISYGKVESYKKLLVQTYSAVLSHSDQAKRLINYLNINGNQTSSKTKFSNSKYKI